MFRHILVPLDESDLAGSLLAQAVKFARTFGARMTFFTMAEDCGATQEGVLMLTLSPKRFENEMERKAEAPNVLSRAMEAGQAAALVCDAVVRVVSEACVQIIQTAQKKGCGLIYMTSNGHRSMKALVLGSQTQKVLTHSTLPVFVAKASPSSRRWCYSGRNRYYY